MNKNKLAQELYEGWSRVDVAFRLRILPRIAKSGVSAAQFEVLFALNHFGKKDVAIKDLAELSLKTSSAVTQLVAGLEKENLVKRVHSKTDRRVVHVSITNEGLTRFHELYSMMVSSVERTIVNLSDAEVREYIRINNKIAENI